MKDTVGRVTKSRLTERVLDRITDRTEVLSLQALLTVRAEMGQGTHISTDAIGQIHLLAYQAALMEEQVADIKEIRDRHKVS